MKIQNADLNITNKEKIKDIVDTLHEIIEIKNPKEGKAYLENLEGSILCYLLDNDDNTIIKKSNGMTTMEYGVSEIEEDLEEEWDEGEMGEELEGDMDEDFFEDYLEELEDNEDEGFERKIKLNATPIKDGNSFTKYLNTVVEINEAGERIYNLNQYNKDYIGYLAYYLQNITEEEYGELNEIFTKEELILIEKALTDIYFMYCHY
ncbi:hypothetical protein [Sutcliffiella cohnii]|uniref:hypothetical protein n=1 Tax=Sutcliffiella cohnii TaxID=33932 RepID=UPI002E2479DF|nr:hypothetical protein [Sutcliffiella cohnii]